MRPMVRLMGVAVAGLGTAAIATGAVLWMTRPTEPAGLVPAAVSTPDDQARAEPEPAKPARVGEGRESFPDPNAPGSEARVFLDPEFFDGNIFSTATTYNQPVGEKSTLNEEIAAMRGRIGRGLATLQRHLGRLKLDTPPTAAQAREAIQVQRWIADLYLYDGKTAEATTWLERALELARTPGVREAEEAEIRALIGIAALRRGELDNCIACLGPSSCIFPIDRAAVHINPAGSREAIKQFTLYLERWPGDLRVRWLLNLAYMTLGEYPAKVPRAYLVPIEALESEADVGRFTNVAPLVGLNRRGPNLAGGSIFDDFDGDGRLDLFATSVDLDKGAALFLNRGDGTFADRSKAAGLDDQAYALNAARADFDNDGNPDVLLMRGAWDKPARLSLLRNKGKGIFEDVTLSAGLGEPIATESAVWGDYDNDGLVDLFVCGEYRTRTFEPRNQCRLYHNEGNGKFVNVATAAGVLDREYAKGSAWGDYDGDGRLDLYVSNMDGHCRLYHNEGDGTFRNVAEQVGITGSPRSFSCLFWDFDNDGRLDLFVNDYGSNLAEFVALAHGLPLKDPGHPRLYRNLGPEGFREVSREVGLDRPYATMGLNCGDIDNDGYLDLYLGTGWMSYSGLVPNALIQNVGGRQFVDVTTSSGTGHLQKGHGVSFGDWDDDGDLDLFIVQGGAYIGDRGYNALFQNPGHGRHWLKVKLVGTKTNRSAIGADIRAEFKDADGKARLVHRVIGNNGSFGGNPLIESIGLGDSRLVDRLTITWPTSRTTQTFENLEADHALEITEGADAYKVIDQPPLPTPKR